MVVLHPAKVAHFKEAFGRRAPHRAAWHQLLVMVLVAATSLVTGCGWPTTGAQGESASLSLPHTVTYLSPITTGAVSEFRLPVPARSMYTVLPSSLTTGPDGALWFTEVLTGRVARFTPSRFTPSGTLTEFILPGTDSYGHLPTPEGMTVGPDKALWFVVLAHSSPVPWWIGRLTHSGVLTQYDLPPTFWDAVYITTGPDGALWVSGSGSQIGRLTLAGRFTAFDIPLAHGSTTYGITAGPDGAVWFTTELDIGRITPAGTLTWMTPGPSLSSGFGAVTLGADGNLWLIVSGAIGRLSPTGALTKFALPLRGTAPYGITEGPDGNVWFTQRYASMIGRITPRGHITEFRLPLPPHAAPGSDDVVSIAVGPDGAICFIQQQANEHGCLAAWRVWLEAVMDPSYSGLQ